MSKTQFIGGDLHGKRFDTKDKDDVIFHFFNEKLATNYSIDNDLKKSSVKKQVYIRKTFSQNVNGTIRVFYVFLLDGFPVEDAEKYLNNGE